MPGFYYNIHINIKYLQPFNNIHSYRLVRLMLRDHHPVLSMLSVYNKANYLIYSLDRVLLYLSSGEYQIDFLRDFHLYYESLACRAKGFIILLWT